MATTFAAGQKIRASDLNNIAMRGRVASLASSGAGSAMSFNTTESVGTSQAAACTSGRRYRARFVGVANASSAGANGFFKIRYKAGVTIDTTGTVMPGAQGAPNLSRGLGGDNNSVVIEGEFAAPTTDTYTFVLTGKSSGGTVNVASDASNHGWLFTLDDVTN